MKTSALRTAVGTAVACLGFIAHYVCADTLDVWKLRNPHLSLGTHWKVNFLNGQYVAFQGSAGLAVSKDGTNWAALPLPFDGSTINQIAYGNGQYVAVGGTATGSLLATSPDLTNWTFAAAGPDRALNSVAFGGGVFAAVGSTGSAALGTFTSFVITSTNGSDWTRQNSPTNTGVVDIVYGNGRFVAALNDAGPQFMVSTDGTSWLPVNYTTNRFFQTITFAAGQFYAGGYYWGPYSANYPALAVSPDGFTWAPCTDPRAYGYPLFHAVSGNGILLGTTGDTANPLSVSVDGTNFVAITSNTFSNYNIGVAFGNGLFVNAFLQTSPDGTNWSASAVPPTNSYSSYSVQDIFTGTNGYTAFTVTAPLLVSPNGLQFSFVTNNPPAYERVKYANGLYHAVGAGGILGRSTNGLDWVGRTSATGNSLHDIEYGNSTWVAVGDNGTITRSSTGNTWALSTSGTSLGLNGIVYATNQFVVVGDTGTVLTSPNGSAWVPQFSGTLQTLNQVAYGNGQFVAVGANGIVVTSPDGANWTPQVSGVQATLTGVAFGDGVFCAVGAGGNTNVVLISTDGASWTQRNSGGIQSMTGGTAGVRFLNGTFFVFSDTNIAQSGPVIAPQLQVVFSNGQPRVNVQCSSNLLLRLESANALQGPWTDCGLLTNSLGAGFTYPDDSASGQPQRFYRAVAP